MAKFKQNRGEIWAKVIKFGRNQILASPKTFDLLMATMLCDNWFTYVINSILPQI